MSVELSPSGQLGFHREQLRSRNPGTYAPDTGLTANGIDGDNDNLQAPSRSSSR